MVQALSNWASPFKAHNGIWPINLGFCANLIDFVFSFNPSSNPNYNAFRG